MNMACTLFGLTPEEALLGMTAHAARALGLERDVGTLAPGKAADLCVWRVESLAELGYWIGVPYWGRGYATEAAREVVKYGFEKVQLNRIFAAHFKHNPASGKVLQKIGMKYEGCMRQNILKWGDFIDVEVYSILRQEFDAAVK